MQRTILVPRNPGPGAKYFQSKAPTCLCLGRVAEAAGALTTRDYPQSSSQGCHSFPRGGGGPSPRLPGQGEETGELRSLLKVAGQRGLPDVPWPQCLYLVLLAGPIPSTFHLSSFWGTQKTAVRRKMEGKFHLSFLPKFHKEQARSLVSPSWKEIAHVAGLAPPQTPTLPPCPPCASHRHLLLNCKRPNPPGMSV